MATLTGFKFMDPDGAGKMLEKSSRLQKAQLIKILAAAIVTWPEGKKAPKPRQTVNLPAGAALDGAFRGMLFELIATNLSKGEHNELRAAFEAA